MRKCAKLKDIPGRKIRRQYFHIPIYLFLSLWVSLVAALSVVAIQTDVSFNQWLRDLAFLLFLAEVILIPLVVLSVLNRFCFGKVICVLDERGLYYEDDGIQFVEWKQVREAVYEPDLPGWIGHRFFCCNLLCLTVRPFQKIIKIELDHAPLLLLRAVRKYCPGIPCRLSKAGILIVALFSVGLPIAAALCAWAV